MRRKPTRLQLVALVLGTFALVAAACGGDDDEGTEGTTEAKRGGTVTYAAEQEPTGWNMNTASDNQAAAAWVLVNVFPQPFITLPDYTVELNTELLDSAEEVSADPFTVEYAIRDDAVWSDGTPISVDDFKFFFDSTMDPNGDVADTSGYDRIDRIEGDKGAKTFRIVFAEPYADWKRLFGNLLPAHILKDVSGWNDGLDGKDFPKFSGGPMIVTDYTPEQSATLEPNPKYWGKNKMKLDKIVVRYGIEPDGLPAAFENGEIDVAYPQPQLDLVEEIDALGDEVGAKLSFGLQFEHLDFNFDNKLLADPAVRQAIAYGLDEVDLVTRTVRQFDDEAEPLYGRMYVNNQPEYEPHGEEYKGVDVEKAVSTLESAGYTKGSGGIYEKDGQRLSFRISTTGGNALRESSQEILQQQFKEFGVELKIDNLAGTQVFDKFFPEPGQPKDYDIALFAWVATPYASSNESLYQTDGGQNNMGWSNAEVDKKMADAVATTDPQEAARLWNEVDEIMWQPSELPTIALYQKPTYLPFRSSILNVEDNATTFGPLWNAYDWQLKS